MEIKTKFDIGDKVLVKSAIEKGAKPVIFKVTSIEIWVSKPDNDIVQETRYTLLAITSDGPTIGMGTTTSEANLILATETEVKKELDAYTKVVYTQLMENCYLADSVPNK